MWFRIKLNKVEKQEQFMRISLSKKTWLKPIKSVLDVDRIRRNQSLETIIGKTTIVIKWNFLQPAEYEKKEKKEV